jgi:hypothetical protein
VQCPWQFFRWEVPFGSRKQGKSLEASEQKKERKKGGGQRTLDTTSQANFEQWPRTQK